jgi:hypothetical protein
MPTWLSFFDNLISLDLSNNLLTSIDTHVLNKLTNLERLMLNGNLFEIFMPNHFETWMLNMKSLDLSAQRIANRSLVVHIDFNMPDSGMTIDLRENEVHFDQNATCAFQNDSKRANIKFLVSKAVESLREFPCWASFLKNVYYLPNKTKILPTVGECELNCEGLEVSEQNVTEKDQKITDFFSRKPEITELKTTPFVSSTFSTTTTAITTRTENSQETNDMTESRSAEADQTTALMMTSDNDSTFDKVSRSTEAELINFETITLEPTMTEDEFITDPHLRETTTIENFDISNRRDKANENTDFILNHNDSIISTVSFETEIKPTDSSEITMEPTTSEVESIQETTSILLNPELTETTTIMTSTTMITTTSIDNEPTNTTVQADMQDGELDSCSGRAWVQYHEFSSYDNEPFFKEQSHKSRCDQPDTGFVKIFNELISQMRISRGKVSVTGEKKSLSQIVKESRLRRDELTFLEGQVKLLYDNLLKIDDLLTDTVLNLIQF